MTAQTILPANSAASGGYDVDNSLRFNDGSSDHLLIAPSSAGNKQTWTWSAWVKRGVLGTRQVLFSGYDQAAGLGESIEFTSGDLLEYDLDIAGTDFTVTSSMVFRDVSAWYHILFIKDVTESTETNRIKVYVNGVQIALVESANGYPAENATNGLINAAGDYEHHVGCLVPNSSFFDGYMCEVVFIDGAAQTNTDFGEFGEDSGIWKPIDVSGLTFGTNGFYFEFKGSGTSANSSGLGADTSGNDHHFTVTNLTAVDQSTDTCTNNFATWNSLIKTTSTLSEGNLKYAQPGSNPVFGSLSTIGVTAGKWYAELNYTSGSNHKLVLGVADETFQNGNTTASYDLGKSSTTSSIAYVVNTGDYRVNNSNTSWGSGGGDGQIINMAIDRDNGKIYFGVNGTWGNSSDPAAGSGGIPTTALDSSTNWFWGITADTSGTSDVGELNFGSPSYSESGGETDGNGYGNFANAVPSGYYVLNSKNLAEYG
jgi:hypothetical protein